MSQRFAQRGARRRWPDFILVVFFLCLAILACNLPLGDRRQEANDGLYLAPRAADGTVSGSYHYPSSLKNKKVNFSVSAEGYATFQVDDAPASEQLTVSLLDENFAGMNWAGLTLDGYGDLSAEEQSVLQALGNSDLMQALSLIPLEAACQGEAQIEPQQMAALLFPLQMYFKYQVAERGTVAHELMSLSNCMAPGDADNPSARPLQVYMTAANPIPVVLGYFPFDAEGALERTDSGLPARGLASLIPLSAAGFDPLMAAHAQAGFEPVGFFPVVRDQLGPCDAKCRGACGPDCTLNNCKLSADYRCEEDENGNNTGQISYLHIYDCGLHPACIKHDQCYDDCNQRYGCGTFKAAHCRHGGWNDGMNLPENYYCDKHTVHEESLSNVKGWVDGFGPQTIRQVFVYTDEKLSHLDDLENCPLPMAGTGIGLEPTTPANEEIPSPASEPGGWVWTRVETELNPEQKPIEVCAEKPGRCTWFNVTESGCTIDKIETQTVTDTKIYEYQLSCSCGAPPDEILPGEEYRLEISCSGGLIYAAEGNSWIEGQGAISYYSLVNPAHKQFLQPYEQQFWFRPWHPQYDGTTSLEWVFFGPWGELGDEFELVARCGEEPCKIHWRYELKEKK